MEGSLTLDATISVIVPIFNVAPYLPACLSSIARQSHQALQVVMIDDGSTDDSATIAGRFAARDDRFTLLQQHNQGLGAARNAGLLHATGEFLAFVDSDDLLAQDALAVMVATLHESGSDFAAGVVRRFDARGSHRSSITPYGRSKLGTHVTVSPKLLRDRLVTNKLWRRSFWDRLKLRFDEGVLYEDVWVARKAHIEAGAVDVLGDTVYWWRLRGAGETSITKNRAVAKGVIDRVDVAHRVAELLSQKGLHDLKRRYDLAALARELKMFVDVADQGDREYRGALRDSIGGFVRSVEDGVLEDLRAIDRLKYHLLERGLLDELLHVLAFERTQLRASGAVGKGEELYGDYPYLDDPELAVPRGVYRLRSELRVNAAIRVLRWRDGRLELRGHAYVQHVDAPTPDALRTRLLVRDVRAGTQVSVPVRQQHRPGVTVRSGQLAHCYDGAAFTATLDVQQLLSDAGESELQIGVEVEANGVRRTTQ